MQYTEHICRRARLDLDLGVIAIWPAKAPRAFLTTIADRLGRIAAIAYAKLAGSGGSGGFYRASGDKNRVSRHEGALLRLDGASDIYALSSTKASGKDEDMVTTGR